MATSWSDLTPELQERVAEFLPGNEVTCSLRLLNKPAAELFRSVARVRLSEPVPPHAFAWRWGSPAAFRNLTREARQQVLALTAASGVLSNLQVAVAAAGCWPDSSAFTSAASAGHLYICEWLQSRGYHCSKNGAAEAAASKGHMALLRWILSQCNGGRGFLRADANESALRGAARAGRRDVCEALQAEAGPDFVVLLSDVYDAAEGGHADLVHWLLPYVPVKELDEDELLQHAAHGCDLAGLQHVYGNLPSVQQDGWRPLLQGGIGLLLAALTSPSPDWRAKVDWLGGRGCTSNDWISTRGPRFKLPDTLQPSDRIERARLYLQLLPEAERAGAVKNILSNAIRLAAPELVDFALEQWPHTQLADFADVVYWRYTSNDSKAFIKGCGVNQFQSDFETPAQVVLAARLAAAGVPIWPTVMMAAVQTGSLQMLQWMAAGAEAAGQEGAAGAGVHVADLAGAGPEVRAAAAAALRVALERSGADLASLAAEAGNLEMMQWLRAHGCAWKAQTFTKATQAGNIALLEWMAEEGCPLPDHQYTSVCYKYSIRNQDLVVLQCLRRLGVPWGGRQRELLGCAVGSRYRLEVLALLLQEGCALEWNQARKAVENLEGTTADAVRALIQQRATESGCTSDEWSD